MSSDNSTNSMKLYYVSAANLNGEDASLFVETDAGPQDALALWKTWDFVEEDAETIDVKVFEVKSRGVRRVLNWHDDVELSLEQTHGTAANP